MSDLIELAEIELWSDVPGDDNPFHHSRMLAHYTGLSTVAQIIESRQLWLSHPLYMNDSQELRHGVLTAERLILESEELRAAWGDPEMAAEFVRSYREKMDEDGRTSAWDTYIACFCEHDADEDDGLLSMWRAYGANGGGAALVFDTGKLPEIEDSPLILKKVKYVTQKQREAEINALISIVIAFIAEHSTSLGPNDHVRLGNSLYQRLKFLSLSTKHFGFREEREWRLIYLPELDQRHLFADCLSYDISSKGMQPKLKFSFDSPRLGGVPPLSAFLDHILLGPTQQNPQLAALAMERLLEVKAPELADRVRVSSTPYRP